MRPIISSALRRPLADLVSGSSLALAWIVASALLARLAFGHDWYFEILLAVGALFLFLVAWLLYLRDDGLGRLPTSMEAAADSRPESSSPEAPEESRFFARPAAGIIARSEDRSRKVLDPGASRRVLLWAASLLVLASVLFNLIAGFGSRYR